MNFLSNIKYEGFKKGKFFINYIKSKFPKNKISNFEYIRLKNDLKDIEFVDQEVIREYQLMKLIDLLEYSYENVPYYFNLFNDIKMKPSDIRAVDDLINIPYLTKKIISENYDNLISRCVNHKNIQVNKTGGTTGVPLKFATEKLISRYREKAFVERYFDWGDYDENEINLVLRGKKFINTGFTNWWWEFDPNNKVLFISSHELSNLDNEKILSLIKKYKPKYIQGYPSSVFQFAKKIKNYASEINYIKSVFTSSETLYEDQRIYIEDVLNTKIYDLYGHRERAAMIHQCEEGSYHIIPEYGVIELVKPKYENKMGALEIVATGFNNFAMPFIRYRTGDLAIPKEGICNCGRKQKLIKKIIGREQDYFVNKQGVKVPIISNKAYGLIFKISSNVKEFKYKQEKKGSVEILIVPEKDFSNKDRRLILEKFNEKFSGIKFNLNVVEVINKSDHGKLKIIDQNIK